MEGSQKVESEFIKHCNFWRDNVEGVTDCLSRGVDVNTTNEYGRTGLMLACKRGNSAIVSRLVQVAGLDINYQDRVGDTAALLASREGQTECLRILADTGRVDCSKTGSGLTLRY